MNIIIFPEGHTYIKVIRYIESSCMIKVKCLAYTHGINYKPLIIPPPRTPSAHIQCTEFKVIKLVTATTRTFSILELPCIHYSRPTFALGTVCSTLHRPFGKTDGVMELGHVNPELKALPSGFSVTLPSRPFTLAIER